jgi:hypothetical protein
VRHIRRRFDQRRTQSRGLLDALLRRALGLDLKALQYAEGKRFVDAAVRELGNGRLQPRVGVAATPADPAGDPRAVPGWSASRARPRSPPADAQAAEVGGVTGPPAATAAVRVAVRRSLADLPELPRSPRRCPGAPTPSRSPPRSRSCGRGRTALVVDHGLQRGSAGVAARAAAQCRSLGLVASVLTPDDEPADDRGGGPEARAAERRYGALDDAARRHGLRAVLLGHTLDDQAESVLLGLARGSGARSLAAMAPVRGRYRRPLLGATRATTRAACREPASSRGRTRTTRCRRTPAYGCATSCCRSSRSSSAPASGGRARPHGAAAARRRGRPRRPHPRHRRRRRAARPAARACAGGR